MAATISSDFLRELATFKADRGCAISIYVNLDPSVAATQPDVAARVKAVLADAGRRADELRPTLDHSRREGLKADLERVRQWFDDEFDRDGSHGAAVFVDGLDELWRTERTTHAVEDAVRFGDQLYLAPLVRLVGDADGALVAYVGRERAEVFRLEDERLVELADRTEQVPGRHDQGGWSQSRYERHIENIVERHLRGLADAVNAWTRKIPGVPLVLVGGDEIRPEFEAVLSNESRAALAGWTTAERHASPGELLKAASPLLAEWRASRERELLDRWREEAGRSGRATAGWHETLAAASDARVDVLLLREGATSRAFRCPECGRGQADEGACPLDGTTLVADDGLEVVVHQTLVNGGTVQVIRAHQDLEPVEGIGAILRF
jgi:peptide chain release factor subunit 1